MISVECPDCGHAQHFAAQLAGEQGNCQQCQASVPIPNTTANADNAPSNTNGTAGEVPVLEVRSWYYEENGKRVGPYSQEDLRALLKKGTLEASTLVWQRGMKEWIALSETSLLDHVASPPPPSPGGKSAMQSSGYWPSPSPLATC